MSCRLWRGSGRFADEADAGVVVAGIPELPAVGVVGVGGGDLGGDLLGAEDDATEGVVAEGLQPGAQLERVDVGARDALVERELDGVWMSSLVARGLAWPGMPCAKPEG